ncbi:MAG: hypothetical protein REI11_16510, partial [Patulibacter sp.]|nr:hypothetical protein [Patulibacter sp.]
MRRPSDHRSTAGAFTVLAVAVPLLAAGPAHAAGSGIAACAVKKGSKAGQLRILTGGKSCKSTETPITLTASTTTQTTQSSPIGAVGPTGPAGPAGPTGPAGPVGPGGATGPIGSVSA